MWVSPALTRVMVFNFSPGDVFLDSPAIKCGQLIYATCQTNKTNTVTINGSCGNISYGSHTFERGSDRYVLLGQLELTMVKAEEDPFNSLLTDFEIRVTEKAGKPFNMSCSDAFTKDDRQYPVPSSFSSMVVTEYGLLMVSSISYTGGNCSVAISMKGDVLKWDPPACEGWKDVEHYTVVNGNGSLFTIKNHVSLSKLTNGAAIIVKATNRCKETATIAIWNPIGTYSMLWLLESNLYVVYLFQ